jgi:general secretion pathway protein A
MYEKFFGLSRDPFSIAPDPRYLFMSERHREALAHLLYGLDAGGGFVMLSGEIGTGKTTVCRCFLEQIPANCNVAYVFNPRLTVLELLHSICEEFHVTLPAGATTAKSMIDPLNRFLLSAHAAGRNNVLIIDEAQNLSSDILEQLRLLTNLETNERKLLQIILIGQPELRDMLARPELEQLAQRVMARFHLDALSESETAAYVAHRLAVAGLRGPQPFDQKAMMHIFKLSRGVPRRINLVCGRALLGAYAGGQREIGKPLVDKAAAEVFGALPTTKRLGEKQSAPAATRPLLLASALGVAVGAALVTAGAYTWGLGANSSVAARAPTATVAAAGERSETVATAAQVSPAASAAKVSNAVIAPALLPAGEFATVLAGSRTTENDAWAALGQFWKLSLASTGKASPCESAEAQQIQCYTKTPLSLSMIRLLDRPGILTLYAPGEKPVYALLTGLTPEAALVKIDGVTHTVALPTLAQTWAGGFSTLWRLPVDMPDASLTSNSPVSIASNLWLGNRLGQSLGFGQTLAADRLKRNELETAVSSRIVSFQLAQGLPPDGKAGPMTLMQLNRGIGLSEPRLQHDKP